MLLPDYHAAGAFFFRFLSESFPGAVFWYGSSLPEKKKAEAYFRAGAEGGRVILGNKSCVFLPLRATGLVIVERPEEDEYRNEDAFRFNAVRLAVKRAKIEGARAVLGSAAPPLEAMKRAADGLVDVIEGSPIESPSASSMTGERNGGRQSHAPDAMIGAIREALDPNGNVVVHSLRRCYAANLSASSAAEPSFARPAVRRRSATIRKRRRWPARAARPFFLTTSYVPTAAPTPSCFRRSALNTWRRA